MKFELKGVDVNILHVLTAKAQAESGLYSSIKIGVDQVPDSAAAALLGAKSAGELKQALWFEGKPRFNKLDDIPINREYLAKHMIEFEGLKETRVTKLWKAKLTQLSEGGFGLVFSIQVEPSSPEFLYLLHELHHKKATITLVQDTSELLDTETTDQPPATKRQSRAPAAAAEAGVAMH